VALVQTLLFLEISGRSGVEKREISIMGKKQKEQEDFKGRNVVTLASTFGEEWAEETFGEGWATHECRGVVKEKRGRVWWVDWDFNEETKMSIEEIKKRTKEHTWRPGGAPVPISSDDEEKTGPEQAPHSKKRKR